MSTYLETLQNTQTDIAGLTEGLEPAQNDDIAKAIASLRMAGLRAPDGIVPSELVRVYSFAMHGLSKLAIGTAVTKMIRGEYEDVSKAFIPTAPELASLVRKEHEKFVKDLDQKKKELTDEYWEQRLSFSRGCEKWSVAAWGPMPNSPGCRVLPHLVKPTDGIGWREA